MGSSEAPTTQKWHFYEIGSSSSLISKDQNQDRIKVTALHWRTLYDKIKDYGWVEKMFI